MPKCLSAESLENITIENIIRYFSSIRTDKKFSGFEDLPTCLINTIVNTALRECSSEAELLLFMNNKITKLRLPPHTSSEIVSLIEKECKSLKYFDCAKLQISETRLFEDIFTCNPGLTHVNLSTTRITDSNLQTLGENCNNLVWLNVSRTEISEKSLKYLSKSIKVLNINETGVIPFGVYSFLKSHTNLEQVHFEHFQEVCRCIGIMLEAEATKGFQCKLKNMNLSSCTGNLSSSLAIASQVFPVLVYLSILNSDLSVKSLTEINQFKYIQHLELGNSSFTQYTIYFSEHIIPVLKQIGHNLLYLSLERIKFVDPVAICESCPKLESLVLATILSFCNLECISEKTPKFRQLSELIIINNLASRITDETLSYLLLSQNLRSVSLTMVPNINLQFWDQILLPDIQFLCFEECNGIDSRMIFKLLSYDSLLCQLSISDCSRLTHQDALHIQQFISEENLDVEFLVKIARPDSILFHEGFLMQDNVRMEDMEDREEID